MTWVNLLVIRTRETPCTIVDCGLSSSFEFGLGFGVLSLNFEFRVLDFETWTRSLESRLWSLEFGFRFVFPAWDVGSNGA